MPKVGLADRLFLAVDSAETPQHVGSVSTYVIPEGSDEDFVRNLVRDTGCFRSARSPVSR